jgi:hypothetical protein
VGLRLLKLRFPSSHSIRHTTVGKAPLEEGWTRHRGLYLTTHNIHNRRTSMPPGGFEPAIPTSDRPETFTLDSSAAGIGEISQCNIWATVWMSRNLIPIQSNALFFMPSTSPRRTIQTYRIGTSVVACVFSSRGNSWPTICMQCGC